MHLKTIFFGLFGLFLCLICEISFLYFINFSTENLYPVVPEESRWDFKKFEKPALTRFITSKCPHFGQVNDDTSTETLREWAKSCWREQRQLGERKMPYNPLELSEKRLCQEILRHCRDKFLILDCPDGSNLERIRVLEKCFNSFIPMKRFKPENRTEIREQAAKSSAIGLAVIIYDYDCRPNQFLYASWERHVNLSVVFTILCPRRDDDYPYPGAELVSAEGASFSIGPNHTRNQNDDHAKLKLAEKLEAALGLLSKRSTALNVAMFVLTTVTPMTHMIIFQYFPRLPGGTMVWLPALVLVAPSIGPMALAPMLRGTAFREWRRRILWIFPMNCLIRLDNQPFTYFTLYILYAFLFGRVIKLLGSLIGITESQAGERPDTYPQADQNGEEPDVGEEEQSPGPPDGDDLINFLVAWLLEIKQQQERDIVDAREAVQRATRILETDAGEDCIICREPMLAKQSVSAFICSGVAHRQFHTECITNWIREGHPTCPLCRCLLAGGDHGF